ncbi:MAG: hypothetical protein QOH35_4827 [Acidobacteriaceae bacterium]|jgi:hypothetical protein|nr:hypothetical protein [Acidobacteriaceae bacterium]
MLRSPVTPIRPEAVPLEPKFYMPGVRRAAEFWEEDFPDLRTQRKF